MPAPMRYVRAAVVPLLLAACAHVPAKDTSARARNARSTTPESARGLEIDDPFPTQDALDEITARPAPPTADLLGDPVAPVDAWTFTTPGATSADETIYAGEDESARALATVLGETGQGRRVVASMQCVAEQMGQFVLTHGDEPAGDVADFITGRCGSTVVSPAVMSQRMPIEEMPRRPLHAAKDRQFLDSIVEVLPAGASVGLWVGRGEDEGVMMVAWGVPEVELEPVPLTSVGRHVDLRGRLSWDYDNLTGYATRGELGALPCRPIPREPVTSPDIALRCPVSADDEMTVVELSATPRDRLLGSRVLRVIVSPDEAGPVSYQAPTLSLPVGADDHDAVALATAVSSLRRKAGMPPVRASAGQSEVIADLLPHFLATTRDQGELADQIAMGMMAGRRVDGEIRWGAFFTTGAPSNWSIERHLAAELLSPQSRARLFDPEATTVAYGSLSDPSHAMRRAVVATYSELRDRDYTEEIVAFFDSIDRQRVARGLEPVIRVQGPSDSKTLAEAALRVREGVQSPDDALDDLLEHFVRTNDRGFRGMLLMPYSLDGWDPEIEGPLVTAPRVAAAVTISHFRPEGAAWGRQLVFVVFTEL